MTGLNNGCKAKKIPVAGETGMREGKDSGSSYEERRTTPVLFLLNMLDVGGSERKIVRIANDLHRREYKIHLAYFNKPDYLRKDLDPDIPVVFLNRAGKVSMRALRRLKKYVRIQGITRIICVNLYPLLYGMTVAYLRGRQDTSCVVLVNTTDLLGAKAPRLMTLYAPLLRRADKVVFGCEYQLEQWVNQYGLPKSKCEYIYNGVDVHWYSMAVEHAKDDLRRSLGLNAGDLVVGSVGVLRPEKQYKDLIRAVERLARNNDSLRAVIVGDGPERVELERFVNDRDLKDKVVFLGEVLDVRPILAIMDVFVLTSVTETFSNAALEAMSMGKPVILTNIGGAQEMVREGRNGYLYKKGNVDELVVLLKRLLGDLELRGRLGENARRIVGEKFTFSRMVDQYEGLLRDI